MLLFLAKSKRLRTIGKLAIIPAIFGINEPLIFGIPILLNPLLFIPYIINPIWNVVSSYTAIAIGIVPRLTGVEIAWSTPQFISGFLAVGPAGTLLQMFNVSVNALIWFPFFKIVDRQALASEQAAQLDKMADLAEQKK
jgi:PTS system cellobiose-specific IIC component